MTNRGRREMRASVTNPAGPCARMLTVMPVPAANTADEENRDGPDDGDLVSRLVRGDADALAELYRRHGSACYRLARHITANVTLAEDAVQEAFVGLWRNPGAYSPARGSVRTWLLGLAHHKAVDSVRREISQQRRQDAHAAQQLLEPREDDPAAITLQEMRAADIRKALSELPDAQREALTLAYFGGYTQTQIAELTQVPLGTVKTRTFTAMRRLRLRLAPFASLPREGSL
jgi:RNA polymerase sigma factor (sigma-70 family)